MMVAATTGINEDDWWALDHAFAALWESHWIEPRQCEDGEVYAEVYAQRRGQDEALGFIVRTTDGWEAVMDNCQMVMPFRTPTEIVAWLAREI